MIVENEIPKYKKKSQRKGLPRADHKHKYETVLLTRYYRHNNFKTGKPEIITEVIPYNVCSVCGRIKDRNKEEKYYKSNPKSCYFFIKEEHLTEEALSLPKWYQDDYFDKFAHRKEDKND